MMFENRVLSYDSRHTSSRVRLRIPKQYHQKPILSDLIRRCRVTINITAALLSVNAVEDGWFDLELRGTVEQVRNAIDYLKDLSLEIWYDSDAANAGW